jgi:DNA/RNA endonuclease YhcR with UshA esterase domain
MNMLTLLTYESVGDLNKPCQYSPMFGRQERVAILLLLGVAVVVISAHLILGTVGKQPFAHTFTEKSADGELVSASGIVEQISYTTNGGHMNVYLNTTTIFIPAQIAQDLILNKGDSISVYGVVQTYRGKKEIVISSIKDIFVIPVNNEKNSPQNSDI